MEAQRWEIELLEEAVDEFWNRFLRERGFLRPFALTQAHLFPANFITAFIGRLNRGWKWSRLRDPGFQIARKMMERVAVLFARDEFVCSIFELDKRVDKRVKRIRDKETKRLKRTIQNSMAQFWITFRRDQTESDLISFANSQIMNFPKGFITKFVIRLERAARWIQGKYPKYTVPYKVMRRLASSVEKPWQFESDYYSTIIALEVEYEEERRKTEMYLKRRQRFHEAWTVEQQEKKAKKKSKKEAFNKATKERKRCATLKNQLNRVGAKSLGLLSDKSW